jgi:hypothetical protein
MTEFDQAVQARLQAVEHNDGLMAAGQAFLQAIIRAGEVAHSLTGGLDFKSRVNHPEFSLGQTAGQKLDHFDADIG